MKGTEQSAAGWRKGDLSSRARAKSTAVVCAAQARVRAGFVGQMMVLCASTRGDKNKRENAEQWCHMLASTAVGSGAAC